MLNSDLNNKLADLLKSTGEGIKNIREQALDQAHSNLENMEEGKQKTFLKDSLKEAIEGNIDVDQFLDKLKKI